MWRKIDNLKFKFVFYIKKKGRLKNENDSSIFFGYKNDC